MFFVYNKDKIISVVIALSTVLVLFLFAATFKQNSLNNIEKIRDTFFISVPYDSSLGLLLSDEESTLL